jgi:excinuclease ABC subunit B
MNQFKLKSQFNPSKQQKKTIEAIVKKIKNDKQHTVLMGVTGSGKTFIMANVVARLNLPTLVLSHNKTLAAQLYEEYRSFFPTNSVKYFVSYYDYYQPEAYVPAKNLYIEKEADINKEIERMRLSAMNSVINRNDSLVVSSVSCIYNIGKPEYYENMTEVIEVDHEYQLSKITHKLADLQYERGDYEFVPGTFRLKGDTLDIFPPHEDYAIRIEFFGDVVDRISITDPLTSSTISEQKRIELFPAKAFVTPPDIIKRITDKIREDLQNQLEHFKELDKNLEAERLKQRTMYDIEMLEQTGFCSGIENYSRYFDGRKPGEAPFSLLDYFPDDYLLIIDESHITIPQVRGMYKGDKARKRTLVEHGFRLPSAMDNRPLNFNEFLTRIGYTVYTSATPDDWEVDKAGGENEVIEQIIRPTGLLDPKIEIKGTENQIDDVIEQVRATTANKQRVLITTLTKRMAEDLSNYLREAGIKVHYLHSDIDTVERVDILRDLRLGVHDVVVGINLLREGLDLPEVSLVIILDADKEGFLRSTTSLIQTIGRAARHKEGKVIMYADEKTDSMKEAISETERRRKIQKEYNKKHNITPQSIKKDIQAAWKQEQQEEIDKDKLNTLPESEIRRNIKLLREKMLLASQNLEYEKAAKLRDKIKVMKQQLK